ncbi:MAG: dihydroxy-acid dehydratase [Candidatus Abyssobacteria bacterium SURF_5]|uniref:Dihydroxy-acid dehydratase n=1 Tax=Abyssobacteria bacterium (strain SURF_5) TaxID=2093360 RepID=A0A3A4PDF8_ABYX5|nr:MAG: dihydroxy-acid dehydratase [Candidatus Abyssubacteria bacterium SURF_5]
MPHRKKDRLSTERRAAAPEADSLRLGTGWTKNDLEKPWALIECSGGDSHPCSVHLKSLADNVRDGILEEGGAPAQYFCTDICDGVAQGTEAMNYSLASREMLAMVGELHANTGHFDCVAFVSGCDKSLPAHLIAAARLKMPAIVVPGGVMQTGPSETTLDMVGTYASLYRRRKMTRKDYQFYREHACPSAGACAFMGTAGTMQILAEAIGMALPGSALLPAGYFLQKRMARSTGRRLLNLFDRRITADKIMTQQALDNAVIIHAAIGGSTNALLHLPAIAHQLGLSFSLRKVAEINSRIPFILNVRPSGMHPSNLVWAAGGVPAIMWELEDFLAMDALTVTGKTVGENLEDLKKTGHFEMLPRFLENHALSKIDIIRTVTDPLQEAGGLAVLWGNLAPEGAVLKRSAIIKEMLKFTGRARVFENSGDALEAIYNKRIVPGDALVIRYQGPKSNGMPEQFYVTEAISSDRVLNRSVALITDGRFSGGSKGPCIGHVSPEAAAGGPIAAVQENDLILIDVENGQLELIGTEGKERSPSAMEKILKKRLKDVQPYQAPRRSGLLKIYTERCVSAHLGAYME